MATANGLAAVARRVREEMLIIGVHPPAAGEPPDTKYRRGFQSPLPAVRVTELSRGGTVLNSYTYVFRPLRIHIDHAEAADLLRYCSIGRRFAADRFARPERQSGGQRSDAGAGARRRGGAQLQGRQECIGLAPPPFAHARAPVLRGIAARRRADQPVLSVAARPDGAALCRAWLRPVDLVPAALVQLAP